ncbi:MAG: MaoC family dehydratase N-terminal domain-containing protein [Planctomycetes bacterium]|nr:MaoC family dehydratase N-terminal domain-containing protein [Planctomycetota bacterium]
MPYQFKGKYFDEFNTGDVYETARRTITEADVVQFAGLSGDFNPLHTDDIFAKENTPFKARIAHGMLVMSAATGLANQSGIFEGTSLALLSMTIKYTGAVFFGDTIRLVLKAAEKKESSKTDRGVVTFDCAVLNQRDEKVVETQWVVMLKRRQS